MRDNNKIQGWYITRLKFIIYYSFCFTKNGIFNSPITLETQLPSTGKIKKKKKKKNYFKYRAYNFRGFGPEDLSSRRRPRN